MESSRDNLKIIIRVHLGIETTTSAAYDGKSSIKDSELTSILLENASDRRNSEPSVEEDCSNHIKMKPAQAYSWRLGIQTFR